MDISNLNDVANIFISVARGFNQGGFNLNLGLASDSKNTNLYYDPEFLTNYEAGFNAQLFDSKMNIAAVIFYSDREDQQVLISTQVDPSDPNTFSFLTQNAAEGINKGIEINIDMQLEESLNFFKLLDIHEVSRKENEQARFTLVFLSATGDEKLVENAKSPLIELTFNWDEKDYDGGRNFDK